MKAAQASSTAKLIAAATLLLDSEPHHAALVAPGAAALCRRMLSGSTRDRWLARSAVSPPTRLLWRALERCTLPGVIEHYWHRKRWIEQRCRAMLAQGFDRVLVLGAGFDTLALRLAAEFAQADLLEIDHPATQAAKRRALGSAAPRGVRFAALDLATQPLATALPGDSRATLVLIEGVLMYLAPAPDNVMFDRGGFFIHSDAIHDPGNASEGCIVVDPPALRWTIWNSGDHYLTVESGDPPAPAPHTTEIA